MDASSCSGKTVASQGAWAMPFDAPFKLGPFTIDSEGRISPFEPHAVPGFLFRWRDRVVRARLGEGEPMAGRLMLQTTIARVPSTAGTPDETLRPRSFDLVRWLERSVPAGWRVCLLADHRVWLETERQIAMPITAAALMTEITCFLLDLEPFIDLLDESGLTVPIATALTQAAAVMPPDGGPAVVAATASGATRP
jgi:hypothetical protein